MDIDGFSDGDTVSIISDTSVNSRGQHDVIDSVLDGVADPDNEKHDLIDMWEPEGDEEAEYLFTPTPPGSLPDVDEVDRMSLASWASCSEEEPLDDNQMSKPTSAKRRKKAPKHSRDSATTQSVPIIDNLLASIEEQGGFSAAKLSWIDFESAVTVGPVAATPCEVAVLNTELHLNNVLSSKETEAVELVEAGKIEEKELENIPRTDPCWYHRILHPGHLGQNHLKSAKLNTMNLHGIPITGIKGAATSSYHAYEVLKGIEEHVSGLGVDEVGFRESRNPYLMRHPATTSAKQKTLLFGMGVTLERASLCSLAQYARDRNGLGPYRWIVPVYDVSHLVQAMYRKVRKSGPELLSPFALQGIVLWSSRNTDFEIKTARCCAYHAYVNKKMFARYQVEPSSELSFHCALYDAQNAAEKARYIASRYFPQITLSESGGFRHPIAAEWIPLPVKKNPPPEPEKLKYLEDLKTLTGDALPEHPWEALYWETAGKETIFGLIEKFISEARQDEAGRLTWAWYQLSSSDFIKRTC